MAGLYIHIPFCKSRCIYCDFFSTTQLHRRSEYIDALLAEWGSLSQLGSISASIDTIYIGGGTPSLLSVDDLYRLLSALPISTASEITLECNPGDISTAYAQACRCMGINRLSIGIQSFDDSVLQYIGRRHSAAEARNAVRIAQEAGFDNISIDLIYALPYFSSTSPTIETLLSREDYNIDEALRLGIQHISTYCLSFEDDTPLWHMLSRGEVQEIDEESANILYDHISHRLQDAGFDHYEVSNFSLPDYHSRHNSHYWDGTPYIGLGAGAHSYDGHRRWWNVSNLEQYIRQSFSRSLLPEVEVLSETDRYNEMIMLGLRTSKGIDYQSLHHPEIVQRYLQYGLLRLTEGSSPHLVATQSGLHILNTLIEALME